MAFLTTASVVVLHVNIFIEIEKKSIHHVFIILCLEHLMIYIWVILIFIRF